MIPHAGAMCLLDAVLDWNANAVRCLSRRFRRPDNPLRRADGVLGASCGIEIAGQAMAVHARLSGGEAGQASHGVLASLRDVRMRVAALDAIGGDLVIEAERLIGDERSASYRFVLIGGGAELLTGRATVLLARGA